MSIQATELSEAVRTILKALAELSSAQAALDLDRERDNAPRDHAMHKAVAAFRTFEAGAKAVKTPLRITIFAKPQVAEQSSPKLLRRAVCSSNREEPTILAPRALHPQSKLLTRFFHSLSGTG